jgi:hypothetical protein
VRIVVARASALFLVCAFAGVSCRRPATQPGVERTEFGVLFGGDIQDRNVIPLELDPAKQELGVRVTFGAPLARDTRVSWELERPTKERSSDGGLLYAAELGETRARSGERRAEGKLRFRRGDPLGTWRVRVRVDDTVVLERQFQVVPASNR